MENMLKITINGEEKLYEKGTTYEAIANEYQEAYQNQIALVTVNGKIRELRKKADRDCTLTFLTLKDDAGHYSYESNY